MLACKEEWIQSFQWLQVFIKDIYGSTFYLLRPIYMLKNLWKLRALEISRKEDFCLLVFFCLFVLI